jgi:hypothetical protein
MVLCLPSQRQNLYVSDVCTCVQEVREERARYLRELLEANIELRDTAAERLQIFIEHEVADLHNRLRVEREVAHISFSFHDVSIVQYSSHRLILLLHFMHTVLTVVV